MGCSLLIPALHKPPTILTAATLCVICLPRFLCTLQISRVISSQTQWLTPSHPRLLKPSTSTAFTTCHGSSSVLWYKSLVPVLHSLTLLTSSLPSSLLLHPSSHHLCSLTTPCCTGGSWVRRQTGSSGEWWKSCSGASSSFFPLLLLLLLPPPSPCLLNVLLVMYTHFPAFHACPASFPLSQTFENTSGLWLDSED